MGSSRKNIQNQQRPVHHLAFQLLLQIIHLGRGQLIVTDDAVGVKHIKHLPDFFDLSPADIRSRMNAFSFLHDRCGYLGSRRGCQLFQFLQ